MMGFLSNLFGKTAASGAADLVNSAGNLAGDIRDAVTGEGNKLKLAELQAQLAQAQAAIALQEAQSSSVFVAGWRPFIGWVLGFSCAVYFPPRFALGMFFWAKQVISTGVFVMPPELGIQDVLGLIASMMGFGMLRSIEKVKGVQGKH